jgi:hypothetical protein
MSLVPRAVSVGRAAFCYACTHSVHSMLLCITKFTASFLTQAGKPQRLRSRQRSAARFDGRLACITTRITNSPARFWGLVPRHGSPRDGGGLADTLRCWIRKAGRGPSLRKVKLSLSQQYPDHRQQLLVLRTCDAEMSPVSRCARGANIVRPNVQFAISYMQCAWPVWDSR